MTVAIPIPPPGGFTVEQYEALNIEYRHVELIDGRIVVNAAPLRWHQRVVLGLTNLLMACAPEDVSVMQEQAVRLSDDTAPEPDVMAIDAEADDYDVRSFPAVVVRLVIEVVSPGNANDDRMDKPGRYARAGIPHFWLVERDGIMPVVHTYERDPLTEVYVPTGVHRERLRLSAPWPIDIELADVVKLH